jgi:flagellar basal-body rod protein FlgB
MIHHGDELLNNSLTGRINLSFSFLCEPARMDPTRIALFDLAEKRMDWIAQRQNVLAANIANANTPGYKGRDVQSFDQVLAGTGTIAPVQTQPGHMGGTAASGLASLVTDAPNTKSLDGNSVALDEQLTRVADTETNQSLVTSIWKSYIGMFNVALGKSA